MGGFTIEMPKAKDAATPPPSTETKASAYTVEMPKTPQPTAAKPPVAPPSPQPTVQQQMPFQSGVAAGAQLSPEKLAAQPTAKRQVAGVVGQFAKGMGDWIDATAKDPLHITDPFEALAKGVEFHIAGHDPFGVGKEDTPVDGIVSALKSGDHTKLKYESGRLLGTVATILAGMEAKDVPSKVKAAGETARAVPLALDKAKVVATTNELLQKLSESTKQQIVEGIKQTRKTGIGGDVQNIAAADVAESKATGVPGSIAPADVATKIAKAVQDNNAAKTPLRGTSQIIKSLQKRYTGPMTWEDLKDFRQEIDSARQSAEGKDYAVLSQAYKDTTNMLATRAEKIGKTDEFNRYVETTKKLTEHERGIVRSLIGADTGVKFHAELEKASNRPQLNDLFNLINIPTSVIDKIAKDYAPLATVSKSADGATSALAGRLQALARHPLVAGTVGAATMMSPLPAKYILSLLTMGKAGELMDRLDAAVAIRRLRGESPSIPGVGGPSPAAQQPPTTPPAAPVAPPLSSTAAPPTGETAASRIVSEAEARRVAKAKAAPQPKVEPKVKPAAPTKVEEPPAKVETKPTAAKPKAYEAFGVTIDPTAWKTPEDVIAGKRAAHAQLDAEVQKRGAALHEKVKAGLGTPGYTEAKSSVDALLADYKKARLSIDKIKTPEIGSIARDVLRKRTQVREATAEFGREQVAKEQASGNVQADIDNGMAIEKYTKLLQAKGLSRVVDKITKAHFDKYDANYELLAKQLQAVYEGVTKKQ